MGGEVGGEVGDLSNKLDLFSNMMDVLSNRPTGFGGREKELRGYLKTIFTCIKYQLSV